jgi:adenylate kinase
VPQAGALDEIVVQQPIDIVVDLEVPRDLVLRRLAARRVCQDCGTNYTATGVEKSPWLCDVCGGDVVQRTDDTEEAINRRLDLYESQTRPLIEYYDKNGLLAVVDGTGAPDEITSRIVAAIDGRSRVAAP